MADGAAAGRDRPAAGPVRGGAGRAAGGRALARRGGAEQLPDPGPGRAAARGRALGRGGRRRHPAAPGQHRAASDVVVLGYQAASPGCGSQPGQSVTWHDHRAHWEAHEPPAQVRRAPGSAQVAIPNWTVKLRTGRRLVDVVGEVRWVPGPSPLPWLAGAALLAMAVVAAGRARRWLSALVAALALVVALDLVQLAGAWSAARPPLARQAARARRLGGRVGPGRPGRPPAAPAAARERPVPAPARRRPPHRRQRPRRPRVPAPLPAGQQPPRLDGPGRGHRQARPRRRRPDRRRPPAPVPARRPGERLAATGRAPRSTTGALLWDCATVSCTSSAGGASRRREPAATASSSTSATVLPWPSPRRPGVFDDDPDLPGGA